MNSCWSVKKLMLGLERELGDDLPYNPNLRLSSVSRPLDF